MNAASPQAPPPPASGSAFLGASGLAIKFDFIKTLVVPGARR